MTQRDRTVVLVLLVVACLAGAWFGLIGPRRDEATTLADKIEQADARLSTATASAAAAEKVKAGYASDYAAVTKLGKAVPADDDVPSLLVQVAQAAGGAKVDFESIKLTSGGAATTAPAATPTAQAAAVGAASSSPTSTTPATTTPAPAATTPAPASAAPAAAAPATAATAATLPPGAAIGTAGFPVMPFDFTMDGSYFQLRSFLKRIDDFVRLDGRRIDVKGRLMTLDGFTLSDGKMSFNATTYVVPVDQGLTAGATPSAPGAGTAASVSSTATPPSATPPAATAVSGSR